MMDRSEVQRRRRDLAEGMCEARAQKRYDAIVHKVVITRARAAAMLDPGAVQLDDLEAWINKRVARVRLLREQGLLEQAAQANQVSPAELAEFMRIAQANQLSPTCSEASQYTWLELADYLKFLRGNRP